MKKVATVLVDDHEIIRFALKQLFEKGLPDIEVDVVGEADNGQQAVDLACRLRPELMILDISMPVLNGVEAARQIRALFPDLRIVVLSGYCRREYLRELIQIGISGYVLKSRVFNDLFEAIGAAMRGEVYLSPGVIGLMTHDYVKIVSGKDAAKGLSLSPRQRQVLQLMAEGKGTKEIARMLEITPKAVESVRHRMMRKLDIDNLADLTKYAIQEGLTTLDF